MNNSRSQPASGTYAKLAKIGYMDPPQDRMVAVDGSVFHIIDFTNTSTGFQAAAYKCEDKIVISYRGTEIKPSHPIETGRDLIGADYGMVKNQLNIQAPDADAFTQRVLDKLKKQHPDWNLQEHVFLTGHSLGATHAEREAAKHKLGGAGFNGYGAVDLDYDVPEGQPKDAPAFDEYVRATDVVSSAALHYGNVHIYATEEDVVQLRAGRYLGAANSTHAPNPLLTADLGAHFVTNFAPDPGARASVMSAANEARYGQYKAAFDHYRSDVRVARLDLHDVLNHSSDPTQAARLEAEVDDALGVVAYRLSVGAVERVTIGAYEHRLEQVGRLAYTSGQEILGVSQAFADNAQVAGHEALSLSEQLSRNAHIAGKVLQQTANAIARDAAALPDPVMGVNVSLGAMAAGYVMHAGAEGLAGGSRLAGEVFDAVAEKAGHQVQATAEFTHGVLDAGSTHARAISRSIDDVSHRMASTQAYDAIVDGIVAVRRGMHAAGDRVERSVERAYARADQAISQGVDNLRQEANQFIGRLAGPGQQGGHGARIAAAEAPSSPARTPSPTISPIDPRHPSHPDHGLYNTLKECIPQAGESRLLQFTAACHANRINEGNLRHVFVDESAGTVGFSAGGLIPAIAIIDIKEPPPPALQSIQHIQQYDRQQAQDRGQFQTQNIHLSVQAQQGPMPDTR